MLKEVQDSDLPVVDFARVLHVELADQREDLGARNSQSTRLSKYKCRAQAWHTVDKKKNACTQSSGDPLPKTALRGEAKSVSGESGGVLGVP